VWTAVIPAIISGLLGAGVASVVAPWSNWGVEKRKSDRQYRRDLVRDWRNGIAKLTSENEALGTGWYESLRPHLTQDEILKVEGEYVPPRRRPQTRQIEIDPPTTGPILPWVANRKSTCWRVRLQGSSASGSFNRSRVARPSTRRCAEWQHRERHPGVLTGVAFVVLGEPVRPSRVDV
jgi:hypothetical protein